MCNIKTNILSWHWAACVRRLNDHSVEYYPSLMWNPPLTDKEFPEEIDSESIENVLLIDLDEILHNYTMTDKYTKAMLITLKLLLQAGQCKEASNTVYSMSFSAFLIIAAWVYASYVLILISNVIMAGTNSENKFQEMSTEIEAFCDAKQVSQELREKIKMCYRHKYQQHYFNEEAIRQSTPANLSKEIIMHSCANLVDKVPLFKEISPLLLQNIISCLKFEIYFPNDVIIKEGSTGDSMYFIAFGTAAIYSAAGEFLCN